METLIKQAEEAAHVLNFLTKRAKENGKASDFTAIAQKLASMDRINMLNHEILECYNKRGGADGVAWGFKQSAYTLKRVHDTLIDAKTMWDLDGIAAEENVTVLSLSIRGSIHMMSGGEINEYTATYIAGFLDGIEECLSDMQDTEEALKTL